MNTVLRAIVYSWNHCYTGEQRLDSRTREFWILGFPIAKVYNFFCSEFAKKRPRAGKTCIFNDPPYNLRLVPIFQENEPWILIRVVSHTAKRENCPFSEGKSLQLVMDQFPQFFDKIAVLALHLKNPLYNIRNVSSKYWKMTIIVGQLHPIRPFSL